MDSEYERKYDFLTDKVTYVRKPQPTDAEYREQCAKTLEANGWTRDIAGEDWDPALDALVTARKHKRGLLVTGAFGCGKTSFLNAILEKRYFIDLCFRKDLEWLDPEDSECEERYYKLRLSDVVLDDLGAECPRNDYGIKRDMVGEYITAYHMHGKGRLFITTNLTADQIYDRYGGRVADRLKELCVPLVFKGKSKRQWMR